MIVRCAALPLCSIHRTACRDQKKLKVDWLAVAHVPRGLTIARIDSITLHHGAWIDSIVTTYELSDGSLMTCANGPRGLCKISPREAHQMNRGPPLTMPLAVAGSRSSTYKFSKSEVLLAIGGLLGFVRRLNVVKDDLMIDHLQFHIKGTDTGLVRVVPEDPESYSSTQGADFFIQGPILAFTGRISGYVCQIQPYLARHRADEDFGLPAPGVTWDDTRKIASMGGSKKDSIKRIKSLIVRSASWIDGIDVTYELRSGRVLTCSHGGTGGVATTIELKGKHDSRKINETRLCRLKVCRTNRRRAL